MQKIPVIYTDRDGNEHKFFNARDYAEFAVADKLLAEFNESDDLQERLENIPASWRIKREIVMSLRVVS